MRQAAGTDRPHGVLWGLQRRLLLLLLLPLGLVGLLSFFLHYQSAGNIARQQDQRLEKLVPLLGDSVVVSAVDPAAPQEPNALLDESPGLVLLLAPP